MIRHRIIPVLLLKNTGLYKGKKFKDHKYIGDPINAIKIFNEKEVDELVLMDITASIENKSPNFDLLYDTAAECFMPLAYGGGINSIEMIREILSVGIEKVILNTSAVKNPDLIKKSSEYFGSSTIVASIDVKKNFFGNYNVHIYSGKEKTKLHPIEWAKQLEELGAGEIIINSIDKDGTKSGYDFELIKQVSKSVKIPIVAAGGAAGINDFVNACKIQGASAAAAGSYFVFQGKHDAVLITYPKQVDIEKAFL